MLSPLMGAGYYLAAQSLGLDAKLIFQDQKKKGEDAAQVTQYALEDSGFKNIVIMAANALGSTPLIGRSFRKFSRARKHKFVSCTGLASLETRQLPGGLKSMDTDYELLRRRAAVLKTVLDQGNHLRITTPAGTDLHVTIQGKESHANDGHFIFPGKGGNVPTGEVYIAPRKKRVEGKVVIDGSSRSINRTTIIKTPITLTVEEGDVVAIRGGREARLLEQSIEWAHQQSTYPWGVRRLGEVGFGLNPQADIMGAMIVDEKATNTAHVTIGSNHWFGGTVYALIHLDQVMKNPTIQVDGQHLDKKLYA